MRDPAFWWAQPGTAGALLFPAAAVYGAVAAWRMGRPGRAAPVPVICIGNFTVGGAGKTPAAIAIAKRLMAAGRRPFFLSRGYGGRLAGPIRVDGHRAAEVGDEPLLLARIAPTMVARDRPSGAAAVAAAGGDVVVMDDGLQNPSLAKDFAIAVVDARRGIGNGRVFPAGPLRAPLDAQLDRVDAVLVIGPDTDAAARATAAATARGLPVLRGELRPDPAAVAALAGRPVLAFAGIADPDKFFATLEACGIPATVRARFPDHHPYTQAELAALLARAERDGITPVTTEKDVARMSGDPAAVALLARTVALPVTLAFLGEDRIGPAVLRAIQRHGLDAKARSN
jgi:tetraacyldisaccharide 4'-kinase